MIRKTTILKHLLRISWVNKGSLRTYSLCADYSTRYILQDKIGTNTLIILNWLYCEGRKELAHTMVRQLLDYN
jgi:hypothetical protein